MEGPAKSRDSFKMLKLVERMNQSLQDLVDGGPRRGCRNCCDKLAAGASHEDCFTGSQQSSVSANITSPAAHASTETLVKRLLAVPAAPFSPRSPIDEYSTGPPVSPAFTSSRRKQLHMDRNKSFDCVTESTVDSTSRIDEVADQVGACNRKVDSLATAMAQIQTSLALVVQSLDCNN
jgi:hypothetical protein